jgi:hypothetical protein
LGFSNAEASEKVLEGYRLPKPEICPPQIYDLIFQCWNENPKDRPTMKDIHDKLTKEMKNSIKITTQRNSQSSIFYTD